MDPIRISVNATNAVCIDSPHPIPTGIVGLRAVFTFSSEWDDLTKTAVCVGSGIARDVLNVKDEVIVPHECLTDPASDLKIGLYGVNSTGDLVIPTVYARVSRLFRGADPSGDESANPTLPIWAQLQAMMGDLGNLTTTAKENLVAAINEAAKRGGGGGGTAADVKMQVADGYIQYSADGGASWNNLIDMSELIGPAGAPGADGADGKDGATGQDGVGIESVVQTKTSTEDGGTNVVTVTKTDGTSSTFQFKNGSKGSQGPAGADGATGADGAPGADGYTPVRGIDYWTPDDQQTIVDDVLAALSIWEGGSY